MVAAALILCLAVWAGGSAAQSCFYTWGGVFVKTIPGPYDTLTILEKCSLEATVSEVFSTATFTSTFTVTDPGNPSFTPYTATSVFTTSFATSAQLWFGMLAPASLLAASYVVGNCVLNYANQGIIGTAAWVGPYQVSTSVGLNGLTTYLCPALVNARTAGAAGYMPTFSMLDCNNNELPYVCAYYYNPIQSVVITVPGSFVTTTVTSPLSTVTGTETYTLFYTTEYESTQTTTRLTVTTIDTQTVVIPVLTSTTTVTATPSTTTSTTSTFTYYYTSFDVVTVSGTDTVTVTSVYTRYTTTVVNAATETFCSARQTI